MRKQFIALSLGLLVFAVLIQSCEKEETVVSKDKQSHSSMRKGEEANPELRLIAFNSLIKEVRNNPEGFERKEFDYSLDSAIWYLEATMNYTYAYPNNKRSALILDSVFMDINLNPNNGLNIIEIQSKFDLTLEVLTSKFNSIKSEHKFLVSVDYKIVKGENGILKLAAFYYFGQFDIYLPDGMWAPAGGEWGIGGYRANINSQTSLVDYDATNKIEQELFAANFVHEIDVFYTDQEDYSGGGFILLPFDYAPCEINYLYEEYFCSDGSCAPMAWLEEERINIYIGNILPTLDYAIQTTDKHVFIQDIIWSFWLVSMPMPYHHYHYYEAKIGKMHPRTYGPQDNYIQ